MPQPPDSSATLPSTTASLRDGGERMCLVATVVFHPDTRRIGQQAQLPRASAARPLLLGRHSPDFALAGAPGGEPLNDPHLSRRALELIYDGDQLALQRGADASRCRVNGRDLLGRAQLPRAALERGVSLELSHTVVLFVRLVPVIAPRPVHPAVAALLLGGSVRMQQLRQEVSALAAVDLDVLVRGPTGTGKELVATALHRASRRAAGPMVSVNMAAIPTELAAAALFGAARGAFTGAERASVGYFRQAQGGTLFLDEIGDTAAAVQPQLLRALQQREVQTVGGAIHSVDLRVVSATDRELGDTHSDFRSALRFRLGAGEIVVPALVEHPEDIGELLRYFVVQAAAGAGCDDALPAPDSPGQQIAAWSRLCSQCLRYRWPGNVRELANLARRVVHGGGAPMLTADLQTLFHDTATSAQDAAAPECDPAAPAHAAAVPERDVAMAVRESPLRHPPRAMADIDDAAFARAMAENGYSAQRVAAQLGVSRSAVYRRIETSAQYRLAADVPADELQAALAASAGDPAAAARRLGVSAGGLRERLRQQRNE